MYTLEKAQEAGLIDEVVSPEDLMKAALEKAKDLGTMGHPSVPYKLFTWRSSKLLVCN